MAGAGSHEGSRSERVWEVLATVGAAVLAGGIAVLLWEGIARSVGLDPGQSALERYGLVAAATLAAAAAVWLVLRIRHADRARRLLAEVEEAERRSGETLSLLESVFAHDPTAMLVINEEMRVVQANRAAERVHGRSLVGDHCYHALFGLAEKCPDCTERCLGPDGTPLGIAQSHSDTRSGEIVELEAHPLTIPGRSYSLLVQRVVTEQKKLQARLLHQEKMAAFGLLAAGIAHDMGNPLSSIGMHLDLLREGEMPEEAAASLHTVRQEVQRLRRTLRELVNFSRRRRDDSTLVSVRAVVEDALRLVRYDRRMRAVDVKVDADPETPPVRLVEDHLMQVVLNLLINALDAMPEGGSLRVEIQGVNETVSLRVRDSGHGMGRAELSRCLEPLYTTKPPGTGTGLGLTISRDILESAGGGIELHSTPGKGTTVIVSLPAARASGEREGRAERSAHPDRRTAVGSA